ncbi:hypothetical protein NDU88_005143 [Pleurodeles waltl]|uniref:Uncharacterized protein n=1 Tax=Pleurodeles waltl TaxID=8319 RepID=A0AAV7TWF2_PLEWA|nr:hypothetical protein NDU88_005143 [Pleurodeles waltl]
MLLKQASNRRLSPVLGYVIKIFINIDDERGHGGLRRGRSSLDAPLAVPGGVARTHSNQLDVLPGRSRRRIPAVAETGGGIRRETPALGACRAGAPPGAKGFGEDSPAGESRQSQHRKGS